MREYRKALDNLQANLSNIDIMQLKTHTFVIKVSSSNPAAMLMCTASKHSRAMCRSCVCIAVYCQLLYISQVRVYCTLSFVNARCSICIRSLSCVSTVYDIVILSVKEKKIEFCEMHLWSWEKSVAMKWAWLVQKTPLQNLRVMIKTDGSKRESA